MNPRLPSRDVACARVAGHAAARTCAAPWTLQASTAITFDTREGASSLVLSCGAFPLAGRRPWSCSTCRAVSGGQHFDPVTGR